MRNTIEKRAVLSLNVWLGGSCCSAAFLPISFGLGVSPSSIQPARVFFSRTAFDNNGFGPTDIKVIGKDSRKLDRHFIQHRGPKKERQPRPEQTYIGFSWKMHPQTIHHLKKRWLVQREVRQHFRPSMPRFQQTLHVGHLVEVHPTFLFGISR